MVTNPSSVPYATTPGVRGTGTTTLGFYAAPAVAQPAAPAQPAATASTNAAPFGYATAAQADAIVTAVRALVAAMSQALGGDGLIS